VIKIFRTIRQRMLQENRFSRYFLYAIGEIVLVVIGIFLALQLNNWNSDRKLEQSNIVLMNKLIGELDLNMERIGYLDSLTNVNGVAKGYRTLLQTTDTALVHVFNGLDTAEVLWLLENDLFMANNFNLHSSVYEEMISTGRFYTLGREGLTKQIDKYYKRLEREENYNQDRNHGVIELWTECKYGWQDLNMDFSKLGKQAIRKHPWLFDPGSKHFLDLKAAIFMSNHVLSTNRDRLLALAQDSEDLILSIEAQIGASPE